MHVNIKNRICTCSKSSFESEKIETKNISIDWKNYKGLAIYFTSFVNSKSIKMLNLHYHELMGKIDEYERKTYFMSDDYMLGRVLGKIKEIAGIEKFDDTKILIDTDDKLSADII